MPWHSRWHSPSKPIDHDKVNAAITKHSNDLHPTEETREQALKAAQEKPAINRVEPSEETKIFRMFKQLVAEMAELKRKIK